MVDPVWLALGFFIWAIMALALLVFFNCHVPGQGCLCTPCQPDAAGVMGSSDSKPLVTAVRALLKERELKLSDRIVSDFKSKGRHSPDLQTCIRDERCQDQVRAGQKVLTNQQDSLSEAEKKKKPRVKKKKRKEVSAKQNETKLKQNETKPLYPSLKDEFPKALASLTLGLSESESGETSSEEDKDDGSSSESEVLDQEDQAELETEAARYETDRYGRDPPYAPYAPPRPSAPPLAACDSASSCFFFCTNNSNMRLTLAKSRLS